MNNIHYCKVVYCVVFFIPVSQIIFRSDTHVVWMELNMLGICFKFHIDIYLLSRFRTDEVDITWRG